MKQLILQHGAHLGFVVIGVVAFLWTAYRKPKDWAGGAAPARPATARQGDARPEAARPGAARAEGADERRPARRVSRTAARRGLLALGPLLGALATGAIIYGVEVGGAGLPGALVWGHAGISVLALLLVGYKLAHLGGRRLRADLSRRRASELLSLALGATSVPLLITGVDLLIVPSTSSFAAYSHLISSVWWTGLLLWHLRRYLRPSVRTVAPPRAQAAPASSLPVWPPPQPARRRG